jgi:hypothetical protein
MGSELQEDGVRSRGRGVACDAGSGGDTLVICPLVIIVVCIFFLLLIVLLLVLVLDVCVPQLGVRLNTSADD